MKRTGYILTAAAVILTASCKPAPILTLSKDSVAAQAAGSTDYITVTSNYEWTARPDQNWIALNPNHGGEGDTKVAVVSLVSSELDPRSGTVTFTCEDISRTLSITQAAKSEITASQATRTVDWDETSLTVELQANISYSVSISQEGSWIKEVATKGMTSRTHTFSLEQNGSHESRRAVITFAEGGSGVKVEVTLTQNGMPSILVIEHSASTFAVPSFSGSSVKGEIDWGDTIVEELSKAVTHSYSSAGSHKIEIQVAGATSFTIGNLSGVETIDLSRI